MNVLMLILSCEVGEFLGAADAPRERKHNVLRVSTQSLDKSELRDPKTMLDYVNILVCK